MKEREHQGEDETLQISKLGNGEVNVNVKWVMVTKKGMTLRNRMGGGMTEGRREIMMRSGRSRTLKMEGKKER